MESKNKSNAWKIIAIVFIILFIVETLLVILIFSVGINQINNKEKCSNICAEKSYESFLFDSMNNLCSCYIGAEVKYQGIIK
jgi:uncharacterized protein YpmS